MMGKWRSPGGGFDGKDILQYMIDHELDISPATRQKYEKELFGDPGSWSEYKALDDILTAQKPQKPKNPKNEKQQKEYAEAMAAYSDNEREIKLSLMDARLRGASSQEMQELINAFKEDELPGFVHDAFEKGELNTGGLFSNAEKTETELLYRMNRGNLDPYFVERTLGDLGTETFIVGDDKKVNAVMGELTARGRDFLNRALSGEGVTVSEGVMAGKGDVLTAGVAEDAKSKGDRDGTVRYKGSDGNYYRVNVDDPQGKRFVEKWNFGDGKWEPYTPKKASKTPASGGDYRRLGLDGVKTGYH
jgi:hypothetical protein